MPAESLLEEIHTCDNNPEESSITKISKHIPCDCSLFTHSLFDNSKSKHDLYRGIDCMRKFCEDLKKHSTDITNYGKKRNATK